MRRAGSLAVAACALAACDAPRPASPTLWTAADVARLYAGGAQPTDAIATDAGLPGGIPLGRIMDANGTLFTHPTLAENYEASYLTTEVWAHFDEVWLQPLYIPVTGWQSGTRTPVKGGWIFSVGPGSRFYSPFWQVIYVDVPDGTAAGALSSVRDVLASGYPLEPGPGRTVALVPSPPTVQPPPTMAPIPIPGTGFIDGQPSSYLDFGGATFQWNADGVIDETPLYVPVYRTRAGDLKPLGVTTIASAGPLRSNASVTGPLVVDGQPRYAAYWRVYLVEIPPPDANAPAGAPNVTVFAPPGWSGLYEQLMADGFTAVSGYPQAVTDAYATDKDAVAKYEGRVSLKPWGANMRPDCFDDPTLYPASQVKPGCNWLSSQYQVETMFSDRIIRTDVTVTCPVIHFDINDIMPVGLQ